MQINRLRAARSDAGVPHRCAPDLRLHLDRLIDQLDESSLRATLKLMLAEARGAIRRKQGLIALERLEGRDTARRIDQLRELESAQDQLMAVYARQIESDDDFVADAHEPTGLAQR